MNTSTLYRTSAVALVVSFVLSLTGGVLHPVIDGESHSVAVFSEPVWPQLLIYAGALALMVGLPGGYLWFRERLGVLGFAGFALYFVGNALSAQAHLVVEAFVAPTLARSADGRQLISDRGEIVDAPAFATLQAVGGLVLVAGLLLIGLALVLRRGLPTWLGAFLVVGAVAVVLPFPERQGLTGLLVELPRGLTVAVLGVMMLRELGSQRATSSAQAARKRAAVDSVA